MEPKFHDAGTLVAEKKCEQTHKQADRQTRFMFYKYIYNWYLQNDLYLYDVTYLNL